MTAPMHRRGFTLLELLLALSIVAALMVILSGGFRIGLAAWQRGEERTARLDRDRSLVVLLQGALAGAFPYRVAFEDGERRAVEQRLQAERKPGVDDGQQCHRPITRAVRA